MVSERAGIRNLEKIACPQGHAYSPANTMMAGRSRKCRECHRVRCRAARARAREARAV
jgi:hypothetical protein